MIRMIVCIKQVPMTSELPWDARTGTLKRELAEGMMDPACKHALEAALTLKSRYGGQVAVITMGPPMAEEILREAFAMGADRCLMLSDKAMAGSDTYATSLILARAIEMFSPDFDLILTGCHTSDSETAQVGPQLAEELGIPVLTYVDSLELKHKTLSITRFSDNFLETLETDLPCLVTISTQHFQPRYVSLSGLQDAFEDHTILSVSVSDLALDPASIGIQGSPTKIVDVYSPRAQKENIVLQGAPKKIVEDLFERFESRIGGVIKKDLKREG